MYITYTLQGSPPGYLRFLTTCILVYNRPQLLHTLIRITSWISLSHYVHFTTYTHQDYSWTLQHCSSGSRPGYKLFIRILPGSLSYIRIYFLDISPTSGYIPGSLSYIRIHSWISCIRIYFLDLYITYIHLLRL